MFSWLKNLFGPPPPATPEYYQAYVLGKRPTDYERMYNGMHIHADMLPFIHSKIVAKILLNKSRYEAVSAKCGVPWDVIACIHSLECDLSFSKHLHNGDSLMRRTVNVPSGRPVAGSPPFEWETSCLDAIRYDGLDINKDWSLNGIGYCFEKYNGFGTRKRGYVSPYLWSYSDFYTRGKYVSDGSWSSSAVSQQCGAMLILKLLKEQA